MKKLLFVTLAAATITACTSTKNEPAAVTTATPVKKDAPVAKAAPAKEIKDDFFSPRNDFPNVPTSAQWEEKNRAALAEATKREVLVKFVESEKAASDLLAQVKAHYQTDCIAARQIAAVTQLVMCQKCPKAPGFRKIWTSALLKAAQESTNAYRTVFFLDQLRWCGCPSQAKAIDEIAAKAKKIADDAKSVADFATQTANEIDVYPMTPDEEGFVSIFNGKDLTGWIGGTTRYGVDPKEPGVLQCFPDRKGLGNLCTEKQYSDFVLRFEFCMPENANNGLGIRMPNPNVDSAYHGMCELQILDDGGSRYYDAAAKKDKLKPYQYHGSVYGIVPSRRDSEGKAMKATAGNGSYLKKPGQWNFQEVQVIGSTIKVYLNGILITDADVSKFKDDGSTPDGKKHPGLHRKAGHIGWLGHGYNVKWRNIRIKEIKNPNEVISPLPVAPRGFTTLFTGKDLKNWKGVTTKEKFHNPIVRQKATPQKRAEIQKFADELMRKHWHIRNGNLFFDGFHGGYSLATAKDYRNFEMYVDWRILSVQGDSGLYLRGAPQVQIWDAHNQWHIGSGGLYNNKIHPSKALTIADKLVGDWNRFYVKMIDDKVTVYLNGTLVVDNVVLENYCDRKSPIFPIEQIELQCHGDPLEFKNIYIRELP